MKYICGCGIRYTAHRKGMVNNMELLFNRDSYLTEFLADVISIEATELNGRPVWDIILNRSCFFPEEGGQDCDHGFIFDVNSDNSYRVIYAALKEGVIHHYVECEERPVILRAHGLIDWDERFDKMQQHSGEHLVSGTVFRYFGFNNTGFHLGAADVTLDFNGKFTDDELLFIEKTVNRAVLENFESKIYYPSAEELKKINYRSKKEIEGEIRIVEYPGYDICACCAPHVKTTGEIGIIKIVASEHFKGGTRMMIKCGWRALSDYNERLKSCKSVSRLLSAKADEISEAVDKLNRDYRELKYAYNELQGDYLDCLVKSALSDTNPVIFIEKADTAVARDAVNSMVERSEGYCGCFIGTDEGGYSFIVSSRVRSCNELLVLMQQQMSAKGGGKTAMIQGSCRGSRRAILSLINSL